MALVVAQILCQPNAVPSLLEQCWGAAKIIQILCQPNAVPSSLEQCCRSLCFLKTTQTTYSILILYYYNLFQLFKLFSFIVCVIWGAAKIIQILCQPNAVPSLLEQCCRSLCFLKTTQTTYSILILYYYNLFQLFKLFSFIVCVIWGAAKIIQISCQRVQSRACSSYAVL